MRSLLLRTLRRLSVSFVVAVALHGGVSFSEAYDVIICGSGGEPAYAQKFQLWGETLTEFLISESGHERKRTQLFLAALGGEGPVATLTNLDNIERKFLELRDEITPEDELFVFLIGHGSHLRGVSKFQIPGPDLTAEDLDDFFSGIEARQIVVVNASSSSGGFINVLSGSGRIIVTATKSSGERNAPLFMESFIRGLTDGTADIDRDERISILEAAYRASILTGEWFEAFDLIPTEHALIDDNGDGLGTRLSAIQLGGLAFLDPEEKKDAKTDGSVAARCYLRDFVFPDVVPLELVDRYRTGLMAVEVLRENKGDYEPNVYYAELEEILIRVARTNQKIRALISSAEESPEKSPEDLGEDGVPEADEEEQQGDREGNQD